MCLPSTSRTSRFAAFTAFGPPEMIASRTRPNEIGLVERLVEPSDLDAAVGRILDAIISGGPKAVNAAKRLVRAVEGKRIDEVTDLTIRRIAEIRVSNEGQEGLRAFLERRDPHW